MKVYLSGAITGLEYSDVTTAFAQAQKEVESQGYLAVNPLNNGLDRSSSWSQHMRADIKLLCDCDMIFMIGDWHNSRGARLEWQIAMQLGIRTFEQNKN